MLRRLHLFEFLDLPRLPRALRTLMTEYLQASQEIAGGRLVELVADRVDELVARRGTRELVDLCSGSGGLWPAVARRLAARGAPVRVTLTDYFPHGEAAARLSPADRALVAYWPEPVDAAGVPESLAGARTIFVGFHHFRPAEAEKILGDAVRAGEPILVVEGTERRLSALALFALTNPIAVLFLTPLVRPFRWSRLLLTYLVPLLPLLILWDGIVSHLRSYTCEELRAMSARVGRDWRWDARRERVPGTPLFATTLIGVPSSG